MSDVDKKAMEVGDALANPVLRSMYYCSRTKAAEEFRKAFYAGVEWFKSEHAEVCGNEFNHVIILKEKLRVAIETLHWYAEASFSGDIWIDGKLVTDDVLNRHARDTIRQLNQT